MANRAILGARGSDKGIFVSQNAVDVTTGSGALAWDSRAVANLNVFSYGQGILAAEQENFTYGGTTYTSDEVTITHNLGYKPAFAVRWCTDNEISSGVATKVWSPQEAWYWEEQGGGGEEDEEEDSETGIGCRLTLTTSTLKIVNASYHDHSNEGHNSNNTFPLFYSYVIFTAENFLGGESL